MSVVLPDLLCFEIHSSNLPNSIAFSTIFPLVYSFFAVLLNWYLNAKLTVNKQKLYTAFLCYKIFFKEQWKNR